MKLDENNLLFKIYRVETPIENVYNPAILDINSHDISPMWVACVMYSVLAKYIDALPENIQNAFQQSTVEIFNKCVDVGMEYIVNHKIEDN